MALKITGVESQVKLDGSLIRLKLILDNGSDLLVEMTPPEIRDLIGAMLEARGRIESRTFERDLPLPETPIHVREIGLSPWRGSDTDAVLTLVVGALPLQFLLPIADLFVLLQRLVPEPDPTPPRAQ